MGKLKMKTHRATAKRFKITGSGKVMRQHSGRNHNTGKKSESNRREARKWEELSKGMAKKVKKSLGL